MCRTQFLTPFAVLVIFSATSLSCSVLIDTKTKQCTVDADCTSIPGAAFAKSTCQSGLCVAPPDTSTGPLGCEEAAPSTEPMVTLSFNISFTAPPKDPKPFSVLACGPLDYDCSAPIAGPIEVPYNDHLAQIKVPPGFKGLLQITNPDGLPALEFLGRPVLQDMHGYDLILPTPSTVKLLIFATGETYDPEGGIFVITTRDCARQPLVGVQVTNSQGGTGFYFQNMSPQKSLTETTSEGAAGFVNVPAGLVSIGATRAGRAMTGNSALSRGGWVTYVEVFP